jgi:arylsulfatase A-like enzyme
MYKPEDMPLPVWDEEEVALWPEPTRQRHFADGQTHSSIGMYKIKDSEWQKIKAFYYGMISHIDDEIGRIIKTLENRGMLDNTIIIFTTDHGELLGDHHLLFKGMSYDVVNSVPLIVTAPDILTPGVVRRLLASSIDIMPTILEMLNLPCHAGVQGESLVPALSDEAFKLRDAVLIEHSDGRRTVRTQDVLFTWHGTGQRGELYDLNVDPDCVKNLWNKEDKAALQRNMLDTLITLMVENVDPLPSRVGAC